MSEPQTLERSYSWPEGFASPPVVLLVDDEANILNSLRRTLRPKGYKVLIATSGEEALQILRSEAVDLVMSDMRMPIMDGAQLLAQVRQHWPDAMRLLLTGYADMESTVSAVNRGGIFRYISKPWDDDELCEILNQALIIRGVAREKQRLEILTVEQNKALQDMNANLEHKVHERTGELQAAHQELTLSNEKLKKSFFTSIQVFSNLIELRAGPLAGHGRRVADIGKKLAEKLGLSSNEKQEILLAGLLHDIGKIGFEDELLAKPVAKMNGDELGQYRKHPANGANALLALPDMKAVANIIRAHHERYDGKGFPANLSGLSIPMGARIIALASDYDDALIGAAFGRKATTEEATEFIAKGRSTRYDPTVVDAFLELSGRPRTAAAPERKIRTADLIVGQVLSRDIYSSDGVLLLAADYILDELLIRQIRDFEEREDLILTLYVRA